MIEWYQRAFAGRPSPCRFFPTCSCYAHEAFEVHGTVRGFWLTLRRLLRCRPLGPSGFDRSRCRCRVLHTDPTAPRPEGLLSDVRNPRRTALVVLRHHEQYTLAIALIAAVVMAITTPLTLKSTKGMLEMQRLAPEMRKLQNEYRNDRTKLNKRS